MKKLKDVVNQSKIYPIGKYSLTQEEFFAVVEQFPGLENVSECESIVGPFDGKINSMYLFNNLNGKDLLFRTRVSRAFRYESVAKEKILYPYLDGTFSKQTPRLGKKIKRLANKKRGKYRFTKENPPLVPVQNLLHFYEPTTQAKENHNKSGNFNPLDILPPKKFPYIVTLKNYVPGRSFFDVLKQTPQEIRYSESIINLFRMSGQLLASLHNNIQFDSFYDKITEIGSNKKNSWIELFKTQWKRNVEDAAQYKPIQPLLDDLDKFYENNLSLISDEDEAVFFHNDFQIQNILVKEKENLPYNSPDKFKINALIDFDNWRIGPRAQDFVKMEYWSIQGDQKYLNAFYDGYSSKHPISDEMVKKIKIYKVLWFVLVFAFEMDKVSKNELKKDVDQRFPSAEKYIKEIAKIVRD